MNGVNMIFNFDDRKNTNNAIQTPWRWIKEDFLRLIDSFIPFFPTNNQEIKDVEDGSEETLENLKLRNEIRQGVFLFLYEFSSVFCALSKSLLLVCLNEIKSIDVLLFLVFLSIYLSTVYIIISFGHSSEK